VAEIIKLACPSCGAKLELTEDVERFACSHCGNEHIVVRRGGIVSLKPVLEALEQVEAGTDRAASELAMARLEKEIYFLREELSKSDPGGGIACSGAMVFGFIGAFLLGSMLFSLFLSFLSRQPVDMSIVFCFAIPAIIAGAIAWRLWSRAKTPTKAWSARQQQLKAQLDAKIAEYQKHRRIVEGKDGGG
jgi:DNA-directed RNA polymerase subunit RPC12/RpoP